MSVQKTVKQALQAGFTATGLDLIDLATQNVKNLIDFSIIPEVQNTMINTMTGGLLTYMGVQNGIISSTPIYIHGQPLLYSYSLQSNTAYVIANVQSPYGCSGVVPDTIIGNQYKLSLLALLRNNILYTSWSQIELQLLPIVTENTPVSLSWYNYIAALTNYIYCHQHGLDGELMAKTLMEECSNRLRNGVGNANVNIYTRMDWIPLEVLLN